MAEPVHKLVVLTVKQDCQMHSCPYRYGDKESETRLTEKLEKKLKHRVADGNDVRKLEAKVKELEKKLAEAEAALAKAKKAKP